MKDNTFVLKVLAHVKDVEQAEGWEVEEKKNTKKVRRYLKEMMYNFEDEVVIHNMDEGDVTSALESLGFKNDTTFYCVKYDKDTKVIFYS